VPNSSPPCAGVLLPWRLQDFARGSPLAALQGFNPKSGSRALAAICAVQKEATPQSGLGSMAKADGYAKASLLGLQQRTAFVGSCAPT